MESIAIAAVIFFLVFLGVYPSPVNKTVEPAIEQIILKHTPDQVGDLPDFKVDGLKSTTHANH